ncbi:MAG: aspartyl/asparaginyl beta-hydroxylase domain-containing protein [Flavobacteriales bacterium]
MSNTTFYNTEGYGFLSEFKENYAQIKNELLAIIDKPIEVNNYSTWIGERPDYLSNPIDKSVAWKTLTFRIFGIDYLPNKEYCPTIAKLIDKYPFIVTAEFSMLEPQTSIHPHTGFTNKLLRAHLGLIIPDGDAAIKIVNDTKKWQNGEILLFDDSKVHEAWNRTDERRVVFMFDFEPNLNTTSAKDVCREVLSKTNDKHLMNIAPREKWLDWLNKGFFY